jgi:hypothetical protein
MANLEDVVGDEHAPHANKAAMTKTQKEMGLALSISSRPGMQS